MTTTVPTSTNQFSVTDSTGNAVGVVTLDSKGFTALSATGKVMGVFSTMAAAIAAITGTS